jgi:hypothetical protein
MKTVDETILQVKISLLESDPLVWRTVLLPSSFTLAKLHEVIQFAMGWEFSHLHEFQTKSGSYSDPKYFTDGFGKKPENEKKVDLASFVEAQIRKFTYIYDFGDGWQHEIKIEKVLKKDPKIHYPVCIAGENACPPEDCGGLPGYYEILDLLSNPRKKDENGMREWVGPDFNPKHFDAEAVNKKHLWKKRW